METSEKTGNAEPGRQNRYDPITGQPNLFDPITGEPIARFDPTTGKPLVQHSTHTAFFPRRSVGYVAAHIGWALLNVLMVLLMTSLPQNDPNAMSTGEAVAGGLFFWGLGACVIAAASFIYRKTKRLP